MQLQSACSPGGVGGDIVLQFWLDVLLSCPAWHRWVHACEQHIITMWLSCDHHMTITWLAWMYVTIMLGGAICCICWIPSVVSFSDSMLSLHDCHVTVSWLIYDCHWDIICFITHLHFAQSAYCIPAGRRLVRGVIQQQHVTTTWLSCDGYVNIDYPLALCRESNLLYLLDTLSMVSFSNSTGSWQKTMQTTMLESYRVRQVYVSSSS